MIRTPQQANSLVGSVSTPTERIQELKLSRQWLSPDRGLTKHGENLLQERGEGCPAAAPEPGVDQGANPPAAGFEDSLWVVAVDPQSRLRDGARLHPWVEERSAAILAVLLLLLS